MHKTEINKRQLVVLIIMAVPGAKFLILPSLLAQSAGRDSWIAAALMFAVDFVCLIAMLLAFTTNKKEMSFFDVLNKTLTHIGAKIILTLYAVFFIYRIILTYISVYELMATMFSTFTNWVGFIVPVLFVVGFNVNKGIKNIARLTEALIFFFVIAALLIVILSAGGGLENLRPVMANGIAPVADAMKRGAFWFSDCIFLVFLLAKFKPPLSGKDASGVKNGKLLFLSASAGFWFAAACTVFFVAVFVSLYGNLAQYGGNALAKISGFGTTLSAKSRLDWLLVMLWLSAVIIKTMVFFYCAASAVREIAGVRAEKAEMIVTLLIGVIILVLPLFADFKNFAENFISNGAGRFICYIPQFVMPLALPLLVRCANRDLKAKAAIDPQKNLSTD